MAKLGSRLSLRERAQRRQRRLHKRRLVAMPLFVATGLADQIAPIPTIEQVTCQLVCWGEDVRCKIEAMGLLDRAWAGLYRSEVAAELAPEEMRVLDDHRLIFPPTSEYAADYWHRVYTLLPGW